MQRKSTSSSPTGVAAIYIPNLCSNNQILPDEVLPYTTVRRWSNAEAAEGPGAPVSDRPMWKSISWVEEPELPPKSSKKLEDLSRKLMPRKFSLMLPSIRLESKKGKAPDRSYQPPDTENRLEVIPPCGNPEETTSACPRICPPVPATSCEATAASQSTGRRSSLSKLKHFFSTRRDSGTAPEKDKTPLYYHDHLEPLARDGMLRFSTVSIVIPRRSLVPKKKVRAVDIIRLEDITTKPCSSTYWQDESYRNRRCTVASPEPSCAPLRETSE
ncbi:unnamed protein product [Periconia digitata]|uniref:Uncharacterized protein n=1 Tax=Periconia digitata TaxID=1303443 RepID=A0A9W4U5W6_9PLEO|nr:unnamed protein product [Periconia digitata]